MSRADPAVVVDPGRWTVRGGEMRADRPIVLGILNLTPDSFSDGGLLDDPAAAVARAQEMLEEGADLIDIGGESTRPGARPVDDREEWGRIGEVVEALARQGVPISVDTTKVGVAERAAEAGASILNDISGLRFEADLAGVAARFGMGLVLMHMRGTPATMQQDTSYGDLVRDVTEGLRRSMNLAIDRGCDASQLVVDPGLGFGKSPEGNLELLARLDLLAALDRPILVGPSRKSFIGKVLGVPVGDRVEGTIAACLSALERGARLFRVHDVLQVRRALDMAWAVKAVRT